MISSKLKTCIGFGDKEPHEAYIFSKKRCKMCNAYWVKANKPETVLGTKENAEARNRTPLERSAAINKRKGAKPIVKKAIAHRTKKNIAEMKAENLAGKLYWESRADINDDVWCEESNAWIGTKDNFNKASLAHIWSKGSNKKYRADPRNFILLRPELHTILDEEDDEHRYAALPNTFQRISDTIDMLKLEYHYRK